jgi:hypothetical protein
LPKSARERGRRLAGQVVGALLYFLESGVPHSCLSSPLPSPCTYSQPPSWLDLPLKEVFKRAAEAQREREEQKQRELEQFEELKGSQLARDAGLFDLCHGGLRFRHDCGKHENIGIKPGHGGPSSKWNEGDQNPLRRDVAAANGLTDPCHRPACGRDSWDRIATSFQVGHLKIPSGENLIWLPVSAKTNIRCEPGNEGAP